MGVFWGVAKISNISGVLEIPVSFFCFCFFYFFFGGGER